MAPNTPAKTQISVTGETLPYAMVLTDTKVFDRLFPPPVIGDGTGAGLESFMLLSVVPKSSLFSEVIVSKGSDEMREIRGFTLYLQA